MLTVLILTHNRPELFSRCIESVLTQHQNIQVIVNNDSSDISEVNNDKVEYHYNKYNHLSQVYKFLLKSAKTEFVYFLEDDDYLRPNIIQYWLDNLHYDLLVGNYYPKYSHHEESKYIFKKLKMYDDDSPYVLHQEHLQLSQYVFRKSLIEDFNFGDDSNINNDELLVRHALSKNPVIKTSSKIFFTQTIDGGDNISFGDTSGYKDSQTV